MRVISFLVLICCPIDVFIINPKSFEPQPENTYEYWDNLVARVLTISTRELLAISPYYTSYNFLRDERIIYSAFHHHLALRSFFLLSLSTR